MALTPEGTPYVESTDLVANYPAASLSLANRVDLVGVLPFATSAARATAIPSPTDGQFTYLQDTNSPEFYNGSAYVPVGTAPGLVIVAPTSIANSGGSASASGGEVTFTGVTSVSLNGCFTSTYDNYKIVSYLTSNQVDANIRNRMRVSGSDASGSNYSRQSLQSSSTTVSGARSSNATDFIVSVAGTGSPTLMVYDMARPFLAASTLFLGKGSGRDIETWDFSGLHTLATSYDGFSIYPSSGTITGTLRVYGYDNS